MKELKIIIDPILSEKESDKYYVIDYYCSNCGSPSGLSFISVAIPKGLKKPKDLECPNCGCKTLY